MKTMVDQVTNKKNVTNIRFFSPFLKYVKYVYLRWTL